MNKIYLSYLLLLIFVIGCKTLKPVGEMKQNTEQAQMSVTDPVSSETVFSDQSTWLLGYFTREQMYRTPHCVWYLNGYDNYKPDSLVVNKLTKIPVDVLTIKIVMGTWCPDSRREVPRFLHVLDLWKFPPERVTFIGVDNAKLSPVGEYNMLDIQRVPTFIFYKNNIEAGRIIEVPVTSLEQDIVNILTKEWKIIN